MKTLSDPYKVRLFTYGTLKKEGRLAALLGNGKFLGEYYTSPSSLVINKRTFDLVGLPKLTTPAVSARIA